MNEGNGASGLESYVRQSLSMPKTPPLFILLDVKSRQRLDVLRRYVDLGVLPDPIALGGKDAVDKKLLQLPESERPPGLQRWDEWGAPKVSAVYLSPSLGSGERCSPSSVRSFTDSLVFFALRRLFAGKRAHRAKVRGMPGRWSTNSWRGCWQCDCWIPWTLLWM